MGKVKKRVIFALASIFLCSVTFAQMKVPDGYVKLKAADVNVVFYYHPDDVRAVHYLAELTPKILARIGEMFREALENFSAQIIVAHSIKDYRLIDPTTPSWSAGRAYPNLGAIVLLSGRAARKARMKIDPDKLLSHELFHLVMHKRVRAHLPRYFEEGVARYVSGEVSFNTFKTLSISLIRGDLIPLGQLVSSFPLPPEKADLAYAESESFVWFLVDRYGPEFLGQIFSALEHERDFARAIENLTGLPLWELERKWRSFLTSHHTVFLVLDPGWLLWWFIVFATLGIGIYKIASSRKRLKEMQEEELANEIGGFVKGGKIIPFKPDLYRKRDKTFRN